MSPEDEVGGRSGEGRLVSRNPATLAVVGEVSEDGPAAVDRAVADARAAQPAWAARGVEARLAVLNRFRDLLFDRRAEIVRTVSAETGKPPAEVVGADVHALLSTVAYLDSEGPGVLEEPLSVDRFAAVGRSTVVREPLGVVAVVSPWNLPFGIPGTQVVPALFAGNAVVLKPAEETPLSAALLRDLLQEAGLPGDVLRVVQGRGSVTGRALVEADVDHVSFTGSTAVGAEIAETCAGRGVTTCLEQGGSDPAVVLADADIDLTTEGVVWARFAAAGQACCAVKRLYVHRSLYPALRDRVVDRVEALRVGWDDGGDGDGDGVGDGDCDGFDVGPLVDEAAVETLHDQVRRSVEMGAEVLVGGEPVADLPGHFYSPTVLAGVTREMPVTTEETFGPVLPISAVEDVDEAVERANDSRYGLNASVWTRDLDRGEEVARRLDAGTVFVNEHLYTFLLHATPWGGYGDSGGDFAHGRWGLESVTRLRHLHVAGGEVSLRAGRVRDPWWFPYDAGTAERIADATRFLYDRSILARLRSAPAVLRSTLRNR